MTEIIGPLNVLVCTKFVPDPNQLQADGNGRPDLKRAPFRINTFDENALEAALQLCAKRPGSRTFAISIISGQMPPRDIFLRALAMGLEALYLIRDEQRIASDPFRLATTLAAGARAIQEAEGVATWDLLLCGEASVDEYNAQVGPRLAEALGVPAITYATRLEILDNLLIAERGIEEHSESVEADLPVLATVGMEINKARMPTILQIMGAGRKPIHELAIDQLPGLDCAALSQRPSLRTLDVSAPPTVRKHVVIEGKSAAEVVDQLMSQLRADGEVTF